MDQQSVTLWLNQLKQGDQSAAKKLWDRYGPTLIRLAKQRYRSCASPAFDEEDLIQCVFTALWSAATTGRLDSVQGRDELWWLLLAVTRRKASSRVAYDMRQKRGSKKIVRTPQDDSDRDSSRFDSTICDPDQPPPDMILIMEEEQLRLLGLLRDDTLRSIALLKLDGFTHEEIAAKLTVTPRTIVRKVHLIRERWVRELDQ